MAKSSNKWFSHEDFTINWGKGLGVKTPVFLLFSLCRNWGHHNTPARQLHGGQKGREGDGKEGTAYAPLFSLVDRAAWVINKEKTWTDTEKRTIILFRGSYR